MHACGHVQFCCFKTTTYDTYFEIIFNKDKHFLGKSREIVFEMFR